MITKTILAILLASSLMLSSCANQQQLLATMTPARVRSAAVVATGFYLQYVAPKPKVALIAKDITVASKIYTKFSNGHVPDPEQFKALLTDYLPDNETKNISILTLGEVYSEAYDVFRVYDPAAQLAYATAALQGANTGATPFVKP